MAGNDAVGKARAEVDRLLAADYDLQARIATLRDKRAANSAKLADATAALEDAERAAAEEARATQRVEIGTAEEVTGV